MFADGIAGVAEAKVNDVLLAVIVGCSRSAATAAVNRSSRSP